MHRDPLGAPKANGRRNLEITQADAAELNWILQFFAPYVQKGAIRLRGVIERGSIDVMPIAGRASSRDRCSIVQRPRAAPSICTMDAAGVDLEPPIAPAALSLLCPSTSPAARFGGLSLASPPSVAAVRMALNPATIICPARPRLRLQRLLAPGTNQRREPKPSRGQTRSRHCLVIPRRRSRRPPLDAPFRPKRRSAL